MFGTNMEVNVGSLHLRNPTILASGIMGLTGASLKRVWESGAGAVTTKSVSLEAREGYPGPRVVQTPSGLLNAMGLPNPGVSNMLEEIEIAKKSGAVVIGSVFGENKKEFELVASKLENGGVDAIELNLSCPHVKTPSIIGHNPDLTRRIVEISREFDIPCWAKLPGNTHHSNLIRVAESAVKGGAKALVLSNTFPGIAIDVDSRRPILGNKTGGLSGPAIRPIGLRLVYEAFKNLEVPIIGVGGIRDAEDAITYLLAGASAVEIGTGIMEKGLEIFEDICEGIARFKGEENIEEIIGSAH